MLALVIAASDIFSTPDAPVGPARPRTAPRLAPDVASTRNADQSPRAAAADDNRLIEDDGQTLWASPTAGPPLDLSYLPPGVQIVVAVRPEGIASHPEGDKVFDSLGPLGERGGQFLDDALQNPQGVKQCIIGCQATSDGRWQTTLVAQLSGGPTAAQHLTSELPDAIKKSHGAATYWLADEWAYYVPDSNDERFLVVAPPELITEIIDLEGSPPPLRRDMERLLAHTDADRHFTLLVAPNFLFSEGQGMFSGQMARLRGPLFWFLGDELSAAALSLHWDDDFFAELIATPTLDTSPERAARILAERLAKVPDRLEDYVVALDAQPFGRRVVARFPTMVRKLAAYTRAGVEAEHAALRCYLPAVAGHNLLMGAELTLAEAAGGVTSTVVARSTTRPSAEAGSAVRERLRQTTSLSFARDTLEAALEQLSKDIGAQIVILGADLQADGITKNQSFGIHMQDQPADEVLVEVLRLANPDKTATGPGDPRQKLVYVIGPAASGEIERILITTRARAAERGDELPPIFGPEQP